METNHNFVPYKVQVEVFEDKVSVETLILIFVKFYCEVNDSQFVFNEITLNSQTYIPFVNQKFEKNYAKIKEDYCHLPTLIENTGIIHSGLCNVIRKMMSEDKQLKKLLGPTGSCLKACSEVSKWTKFIERDFIKSIKKLISIKNIGNIQTESSNEINDVLIKFEDHLSLPPVVSNISKMQHKKNKLKDHNDSELLEYRYAEGLNFLLTDLLLFCYISMYLYFDSFIYQFIQHKCPNLCKWYQTVVQNNPSVKFAAEKCGFKLFNFKYKIDNFKSVLKDQQINPEISLSHKLTPNIFTNLDMVLSLFEPPNLELDNLFQNYDSKFNQISASILIEDNFPKNRRTKKLQQLQNMAAAVLCLSPRSGQTIVDFCCGSGHLGLLLSSLLPHCKIILIENKEESLVRASMQIKKLALQNVTLIRSNIGQFKASFDIGVCLHGCGLVTDLVLNKIFAAKADYVICPCCYGATKNTQHIKYPRSKLFSSIPDSTISFQQVLKAADTPIQTSNLNSSQSNISSNQVLNTITNHLDNLNLPKQINDINNTTNFILSEKESTDNILNSDNEKINLSKRCMNIVDWDRQLLAKELGYQVDNRTMIYPTCTPKNNILIGQLIKS